ncbi:hypothetical protein EDC01DRAFT_712505 [Geopyxis carbonaria]|nr:hypothetical protein EDC01DRAFT_712505 [Geopyxis carbonaria]
MSRRLLASDEKAKKLSKQLETGSVADDGEEYNESTFGGFQDYFRRKRIKLQNRDTKLRSEYAESDAAKIFRGCVITVQGYTNPNSSIIHQLTIKHGGAFLQYMDGKTNVTHIVATNLPPKKRVEFARYKVVRPDWMIESIRQGKLLDWSRYQVIAEPVGQARLGFGSSGPQLVKGKGAEANTYRTPTSVLKTSQARNIVALPPLTANKDWEIPASDEGDLSDQEAPNPWKGIRDEECPPPSHQPERVLPPPFEEDDENEELLDEVSLVGVQISPKETIRVASVSFANSEPPLTAPSGIINGVEAYEAEAIIGEKKHPANAKPKNKRGKKKFLVKWKGYDEKDATWEWEETLREDLGSNVLDEMVEDFRAINHIESSATGNGSRRGKKPSKKSKLPASTSKTRHIEETPKDNRQKLENNVSDLKQSVKTASIHTADDIILPESFSTFILSQSTNADDNNVQSSLIPTENGRHHASTTRDVIIENNSQARTHPIPKEPGPGTQYSLLDEIPNTASADLEGALHKRAKDFGEPEETESFSQSQGTSSLDTNDEPKLPNPYTAPAPQNTRKEEKGVENLQKTSAQKNQTAEEFNTILLANPRVRDASVLNPNFLTKFFQESRLHHLSTWKSELRSKMQALACSSYQKPPVKGRSRKYIMHVDFDSFFAAVSIRDRPELKDKPVAICHGNSENSTSSEIASCNYVARGFGVKNGSWVDSAKKKCPDLVCMGYEFEKYEEASEAFYKVILAVQGERVQAVSIDEALIDISNHVCDEHIVDISRERTKALAIATKVRDQCREKSGCEVSVGIGPNILLAKLALKKAKPAGQYIVSSAESMDFLEDHSVGAFPGIGRHTITKFHENFGVDTVREIRKISKERLKLAFGPNMGEKIYELCRGIDNTEVEGGSPRQSISVDVNWGVRFTNSDQAERFVLELSGEIQKRMKKGGVKGKKLSVKISKRAQDASFATEKFLGCGKCEIISKTHKFGIPTAERHEIGKRAVELLRDCRISPGELRGIGLTMKELESDKIDQGGQRTLNFGSVQVKEEKSDVSVQSIAMAGPMQKPVQEMRIQPYVKPKVTTLMDAFAKKNAAKKQLMKQEIDRTVSSHVKPPVSTPGFISTQFELPPLSQTDPSVLESLGSPLRNSIINQRKLRAKKKPVVERTLEKPPNSQIDIITWNELPQDLRDEQRREYEAEKRVEEKYKAAGKNIQSPQKMKQQTLLYKSPRKNIALKQAPIFHCRTPTKKRPARRRKPNPHGATNPLIHMPKYPRVYDVHGRDVTPWLFTEGGVNVEWFYGLDNASRAAEIQRCVREREKMADERAAIQNKARQQQFRLDNAVRVPVRRRRPAWINSTFPEGLPVLSSDAAGMKSGIRCWTRTEEPDIDDITEWCVFLKDTILIERSLAKAAGYVRTFLLMAGEKEGWCDVCDQTVAAVNEAAALKGLPPLEF